MNHQPINCPKQARKLYAVPLYEEGENRKQRRMAFESFEIRLLSLSRSWFSTALKKMTSGLGGGTNKLIVSRGLR
jgi:hypothetical protein